VLLVSFFICRHFKLNLLILYRYERLFPYGGANHAEKSDEWWTVGNELSIMHAYRNVFGAGLFVSLYRNDPLTLDAVGTKVYFYHSSRRSLADCLQKQWALYKKIADFTNPLQEFKINTTNVII